MRRSHRVVPRYGRLYGGAGSLFLLGQMANVNASSHEVAFSSGVVVWCMPVDRNFSVSLYLQV
jgi:hypothetical protein